jgi:hypothetical protein
MCARCRSTSATGSSIAANRKNVINWYFGASSSTVARVATRRTVGARRATTAGPRARRAPPHGTADPAVVARGDAEEDASAIDAARRAPCDRATDAHAGVMRAREWARAEERGDAGRTEKRIGYSCLQLFSAFIRANSAD